MHSELSSRRPPRPIGELRIWDFRGSDSRILLISKGWDSQVLREFPRDLESATHFADPLINEAWIL